MQQRLLDAGRPPGQKEPVFRGDNFLILVIAVLLALALLRMRARTSPRRPATVGWWSVLVGRALPGARPVPAAVLGGRASGPVTAALDAGFLDAMPAALGAVLPGGGALRRKFPAGAGVGAVHRRAAGPAARSGPARGPGRPRRPRRPAADGPLRRRMGAAGFRGLRDSRVAEPRAVT